MRLARLDRGDLVYHRIDLTGEFGHARIIALTLLNRLNNLLSGTLAGLPLRRAGARRVTSSRGFGTEHGRQVSVRRRFGKDLIQLTPGLPARRTDANETH